MRKFFSTLLLLAVANGAISDEAEDYFNQASKKSANGDFTGAIQDLNKVIELEPYPVGAYNNRGIAKTHAGDFDGAIADFSKALKLEPDFADGYYGRANAKALKEEFDGAIADYSEYIKMAPNSAGGYYGRSAAETYKGDMSKALDGIPERGCWPSASSRATFPRGRGINPTFAEFLLRRARRGQSATGAACR